ncbi:hypothetical protein AB0B66_00505 [Catellatospora sp. NPDC049111]|uniref:hypothetical protein n=1 Tax=Catellatospora sp. NPDC049111 TaxID=3155271 RepID=UPI0033E41A21
MTQEDRPQPPVRAKVRLVQGAMWLLALGVGAPVLALGLERSGAVFGNWWDWPELWARDMWAIGVGLAVFLGATAVGLAVSAAHRRWVGVGTFGPVLAVSLVAVGLAYAAHPERFGDVWAEITSGRLPGF